MKDWCRFSKYIRDNQFCYLANGVQCNGKEDRENCPFWILITLMKMVK